MITNKIIVTIAEDKFFDLIFLCIKLYIGAKIKTRTNPKTTDINIGFSIKKDNTAKEINIAATIILFSSILYIKISF